jgi:predicted nuclease of predicted toxin-antitoxin system
MKVLLDVCTPRQVRQALLGHEVHTAVMMGWGELENGDLVAAAEAAGFEPLIICDKNLRYQQNLSGRRLAILELWTNHRPKLEQHRASIRSAAEGMLPGDYHAVAAPQ